MEGAYLKQVARLADDIEEELPPGHLSLARAVDDDVQALVKVVQELDHASEESSTIRRLDLVLEDFVQEDLKSMREVD